MLTHACSHAQSLGAFAPTTRTHINPMVSKSTQGGLPGQLSRRYQCSNQTEGRYDAHGSGARNCTACTAAIEAGCLSAAPHALTHGSTSRRGLTLALAASTRPYRSRAGSPSQHCSLITTPRRTTCRPRSFGAACEAGHCREHRETRAARTRAGLPSITSHGNACGKLFRWYPCSRPHSRYNGEGLMRPSSCRAWRHKIARLLPALVPTSPWLTAVEAA
jgi:hypothetical protein